MKVINSRLDWNTSRSSLSHIFQLFTHNFPAANDRPSFSAFLTAHWPISYFIHPGRLRLGEVCWWPILDTYHAWLGPQFNNCHIESNRQHTAWLTHWWRYAYVLEWNAEDPVSEQKKSGVFIEQLICGEWSDQLHVFPQNCGDGCWVCGLARDLLLIGLR
jgi:hypothetical protein